MKYIMSINEMLNGYDLVDNEYYKEVNGNDYWYSECFEIQMNILRIIEKSINDIKSIKNIKNIKDIRFSWSGADFSISYKERDNPFTIYSRFFKADDEYFVFVWNSGLQSNSPPKYWRCDQLDGLLKLIKDLLTK